MKGHVPKRSKHGLDDRQLMFIEEYVVDFNAKAAAIRAKYPPKSARTQGFRNLHNPVIATLIGERIKRMRRKVAVTADELIMHMAVMMRDHDVADGQRIRVMQFLMVHLRLMPSGRDAEAPAEESLADFFRKLPPVGPLKKPADGEAEAGTEAGDDDEGK